MLTFIVFLNAMLCAYNCSAFVMQAVVHFTFLDTQYWQENTKYTAAFYVVPLLGEITTAWSAMEEGWYPVNTIILCLGWVLCIPTWYYQIQLSEGEGYGAGPQEEALIICARARAAVWFCRLVTLIIWVGLNM